MGTRERKDYEVLDPNSKRYVHLDMMRTIAVVLVVVDHASPKYANHNTFFAQSWVLQSLWVICGMSWSLTRRPLPSYLLRLALFFTVGVLLNCLAFIIVKRDPLENPHDVIFQMFFIAGLGIYCSVTACLKSALHRCRDKAYSTDGCEAFVEMRGEQVQLEVVCVVSKNDAGRSPSAPEASWQPSAQEEVEAENAGNGATTTPLPPHTSLEAAGGGPASISGADGCPRTEGVPDGARPEVAADSRQAVCSGRPLTAAEFRGAVAFGATLLGSATFQLALGLLLKGRCSTLFADAVSGGGQGTKNWTSDAGDAKVIGQLTAVVSTQLLAHLACRTMRSPRLAPWVSWLLLLNIYGVHVLLLKPVYGHTKFARLFWGLEWFTVGLTAATLGMRFRDRLSCYICRYWFLVPAVLALCWDPVWAVRMDEHQPEDWAVWLRVQLGELICVVVFIVAGEHMFDPKIYTHDQCHWLYLWGLSLFIIHEAVHITMGPTLNWVFLVCIFSPAVWLAKRGRPLWHELRSQGKGV